MITSIEVGDRIRNFLSYPGRDKQQRTKKNTNIKNYRISGFCQRSDQNIICSMSMGTCDLCDLLPFRVCDSWSWLDSWINTVLMDILLINKVINKIHHTLCSYCFCFFP